MKTAQNHICYSITVAVEAAATTTQQLHVKTTEQPSKQNLKRLVKLYLKFLK